MRLRRVSGSALRDDVGNAWDQARIAKAELAQLADQTAAGLATIHERTDITEQQRAQAIRDNADLFEMGRAVAVQKMQSSLALIKQQLEAAAISDLVPSTDAGSRQMVRSEIDRLVDAATRARSDGQGGRPFQPGQPMLVALTQLAQRDPARYGGEVLSYGPVLMQAAGEGSDIAALRANVVALTPGQTERSRAARGALAALKGSRIEGMASGLSFTAKQKVEAALVPPAPDRRTYRPDNLIPRR